LLSRAWLCFAGDCEISDLVSSLVSGENAVDEAKTKAKSLGTVAIISGARLSSVRLLIEQTNRTCTSYIDQVDMRKRSLIANLS
jgi:hypothetical protein